MTTLSDDTPAVETRTLSRRQLLGGIGLVGVGAAAGAVGDHFIGNAPPTSAPGVGGASTVPFYGERQAGIVTPAQDRLCFGVLDVVPGTERADLRSLFAAWTSAAERMTRGQLVGQPGDGSTPPLDTGEAIGSPVSDLTITFGFGPTLFDDRFGLADRRPKGLVTLPVLPNEELDPNYTGGDLCIQACSGDPLVAFHAVRNLARLGMGVVEHRWMELGFGRTSTTSTSQATPRNLLGFKDGTRNLKAEDTDLLAKYVWVGDEAGQSWFSGGSYLVARRIRIFIENWDRDILSDQEQVIGRTKIEGGPLSGGTEFTPPNFHSGAIDPSAHIRLASPEENGGVHILRRGYSYTDGIDPVRGTLLGGLFFLAFMRDPNQFIDLQNKLGMNDLLNEYISHTGSALFACPPGLRAGEHLGAALLA